MHSSTMLWNDLLSLFITQAFFIGQR